MWNQAVVILKYKYFYSVFAYTLKLYTLNGVIQKRGKMQGAFL